MLHKISQIFNGATYDLLYMSDAYKNYLLNNQSASKCSLNKNINVFVLI